MAANMPIDDTIVFVRREIEEGELEYLRVVNIVLAKDGLFFVVTTQGVWEKQSVKDIKIFYNGC